jgi:hypothetical protein
MLPACICAGLALHFLQRPARTRIFHAGLRADAASSRMEYAHWACLLLKFRLNRGRLLAWARCCAHAEMNQQGRM